jgi:predicted ArsR family transcriptional regulator
MDPAQIQAISSLHEPVRRRLYQFVARAGRAVSRDEAADATSIQRALAAFHLDRLADEGLLSVEFRRLSGRTGRGAGRPNKLYRRAERSFDVQLPQRQYRLAASLMAEAIEASGGAAHEALLGAARRRGVEMAHEARTPASPATATVTPTAAPGDSAMEALRSLRSLGFEPNIDEAGDVRLANCPYAALVPQHRETTCAMNLALIEGMLEGLAADGCTARLDPQPGSCCVSLQCGRARD